MRFLFTSFPKKKTPNKISLNRLDRFSPAGPTTRWKGTFFHPEKDSTQQLSTSILSGSREPRCIACSVLQMVTPNRFSSGQQPHRVYLPSLSLYPFSGLIAAPVPARVSVLTHLHIHIIPPGCIRTNRNTPTPCELSPKRHTEGSV